MVKTADAQSLAANVYARLRTAIMGGRYGSGARLLPSELAKEYDVSPTVVREALMRLAEQRLAVATPNRGFHVVNMTLVDMHDLVETRLINEVAALRLSVELGDVAWEAAVIAAYHEMAAYELDSEVWFDRHRAFHVALLTGCGNARLLSLCQDLIEVGDLYLRWSRQLATGTPVNVDWAERVLPGEHNAIMDAALARDADLAAAQYQAHVRRTETLAARAIANARGE
ncbi:GntR family transcriptional regulator [Microbacterium ulmi]|uniref:GntR family transcriptional regulator n=1 Tax=Microbacterium ulmi TaxID=179095 RepID=A0A7Y2LZX6_9MICO|nr:GntR family transcriptional regulator [Microbacterium ulmi]NII68977.1 DNA-binding GntR family transcriptional regulator [Microbacterium ulmi]NNH03960.1 GntR family transcriptional regulator [Microbacterium ulmi]